MSRPHPKVDLNPPVASVGSRIVVTGAAGFIGSHLTNYLLGLGASVIGIDDERTGAWSRVADGCVRVHRDLSLMTIPELVAVCDGADICYHLAAEKYNSASATPQRLIDVNVSATHRLLEGAAAAGVRKVVFTSSLYAYGSLGPGPMRESDVLTPTTVYGTSKAAGEHLLRVAERDHGLRWAIARLFFVYGPRQFAGGGYKSVIVSNFERILAGQAPTIYGDGSQALDYVYIDDVLGALVKLAHSDHDGTTFNIGSGMATLVKDLVDEMVQVSGATVQPIFCPPDWTAGTRRLADTSRASDKLGWQATTMLSDGLARVWKWMEEPDG